MATGEAAADSSGSALGSPSQSGNSAPWFLQKFQDFMPKTKSQWRVYEDIFVQKVKDDLMIAYEHPIEVCGVAAVAGLILLRGPRRFLIRNTLGRFQTEEERVIKLRSYLKEIQGSVGELEKESKNILIRTKHAEEDLQHGRSKLRSAGNEIQRLAKSIYKIENRAADLMDSLRAIPGDSALKLRAEVASMKSDLKTYRRELEDRVTRVTELGIPV